MGKGRKKGGGAGQKGHDVKSCCIVLRKGEVLKKAPDANAAKARPGNERKDNEDKRGEGRG